ncbi:hypothetical protein JZ751_005221 [Albula glossodonta]|uniref:Calponin-homology (CH) domain-containing protein n=1 Tax=Albula glossodonta TaxID=121402 RepID=A0A8T2P5T5_9TELE|nr:hypothetical protein JZ751_005221 [Albula glossodonta]
MTGSEHLQNCSSLVSTYQKWSKEGKALNRRQGHGRPKLIDAHGERRLARVVRSYRRATTSQGAHADPCPLPKAPTMGTLSVLGPHEEDRSCADGEHKAKEHFAPRSGGPHIEHRNLLPNTAAVVCSTEAASGSVFLPALSLHTNALSAELPSHGIASVSPAQGLKALSGDKPSVFAVPALPSPSLNVGAIVFSITHWKTLISHFDKSYQAGLGLNYEMPNLNLKLLCHVLDKLGRKPPLVVNDLFEDIKDGVMLLALLEVLSGQKLVSGRCPGTWGPFLVPASSRHRFVRALNCCEVQRRGHSHPPSPPPPLLNRPGTLRPSASRVPVPCEQGRQLRRIHWVSNIGTALKFLEGRRVSSVLCQTGPKKGIFT